MEKETNKKALFWRVFDWGEKIVIWGWICVSLFCPETVQEYIKQYHILDYLPHESGKEIQLGKIGLLVLGVFILSLPFGILKSILVVLCFIFQKLFPKRDIREL
ncbi:MAG: hypothetical protein IKS41_01980 [Alphaproteobacteria bacterium]|nr:hypothetical protein [Alphaproteobacteria bacterium]